MPHTAYLPGCEKTLRELRTQTWHREDAAPQIKSRDVPAMGHDFSDASKTGEWQDIACRCTRTWQQHQDHPTPCNIASAERKARQLRQGSGPGKCRNGHPRTEEHAERIYRGPGLRPRWFCSTCHEQARQRGIERKRAQREAERAAKAMGSAE